MADRIVEEQLEVVDRDGQVIDIAPRSRVRAQNLRHRTVFVIVRSSGGDVLVHRRADWKDLLPGWWDLAFGGAVEVGEAWDDAARRELAEEAGIASDLRLLGRYDYEGEESRELGQLYDTRCDGPFTHPDGEVAESRFVALDDVERFVADHPVCPAAVAIVLPALAATTP